MVFTKKIKQLGEQFNLPQREVEEILESDNGMVAYNYDDSLVVQATKSVFAKQDAVVKIL
jgi:hypothetical protein